MTDTTTFPAPPEERTEALMTFLHLPPAAEAADAVLAQHGGCECEGCDSARTNAWMFRRAGAGLAHNAEARLHSRPFRPAHEFSAL